MPSGERPYGQNGSYGGRVCGLREIGRLSQGETKKKDLALGDTEGSPGDSRLIWQEIGEVSGIFGIFGHCRGPGRNQDTVEDR